jgi:preprotein translocase subunit SecE
VSDDRRDREDDPRAVPDAELTDEQLDREAPGVDDASELEAAEADVAADAAEGEDKVTPAPVHRRRGAITAEGRDDDAAVPARAGRGSATRSADGAGGGTRSRAAAERARTEEIRRKRSIGRFLREVVAELRKVIWPGRRELITYTTVVIIFVAFVVAFVAGLDLLFAQGVIAVFG